MLCGTGDRRAATEFSFLVGIPTMYAASGYALLDELKGGTGAGTESFTDLGVGFVVSTITAFIAVKWLLRYVQTHSFHVFAYYRVALGAALLLLLPSGA
jgi:undecaprenyl-diphosphatase